MGFQINIIKYFRSCLGKNFALMQCKVAVIEILNFFILTVNEKTHDDPLEIDPQETLNNKIGGLWLNFEPLIKN